MDEISYPTAEIYKVKTQAYKYICKRERKVYTSVRIAGKAHRFKDITN
jgi:hypothetical protein